MRGERLQSCLFPVLGLKLSETNTERRPVWSALLAGECWGVSGPWSESHPTQTNFPSRRRGLHSNRGLHHRVQ